MIKYDNLHDPLAGIINKSIELAEALQKLWSLDEKQTERLATNIQLIAIQEANSIKCEKILLKEGDK